MEREFCVSDNKNQRRKDVVVLDLSYKRGFWYNSDYHVINIVVGPHSLTVPYSQDFVC
jgi:hypothetical protein